MNNTLVPAQLVLSPQGHIFLDTTPQTDEQLPLSEFDKIQSLFNKVPLDGILHLGIHKFDSPLPPSFSFWQQFSAHFVSQVCKLPQAAETTKIPDILPPSQTDVEHFIDQGLLIKGSEYLNANVLLSVWEGLNTALKENLKDFQGSVQTYLQQYNPKWNLVGRICFHLAENKNNEERPFAFLATYTTQMSARAAPQHLPLKNALQEYAGQKNHAGLLALLTPVQKAADHSSFIKNLVDSGAIFQPQTWTIRDAYQFLQQIPLMEASGVMVRIPQWWNTQKPPRPRVSVTVGKNTNSILGLDTLIDFDIGLALDNGQTLTNEEWQALMDSKESLVKIKGQWVEVDKKKLDHVLAHWKQLKNITKNGLSFAEGLKLIAGGGSAILQEDDLPYSEDAVEWSSIVAGDWLKDILNQLRNPKSNQEESVEKTLKQYLKATLRPYQRTGVQWLWLLYQLKLGGCLADDMGLGKTIQILSILLLVKYHLPITQKNMPSLLVVPASLLGNWQSEAERFAPDLNILIAHSSSKEYGKFKPEELANFDLVITTYAFVTRLEWLKETEWNLLILDEAQLIKNAGTKQTRAVKDLKSRVRFTLTGTPIENRLGDLWSLFDFTSPGLLGSSKAFSGFIKQKTKQNNGSLDPGFISTLRNLTQPYILRRLKSDKKIISDLPDKTEMQTFCGLTKKQVQLYQEALNELAEQLSIAKGIQRRGIVLSYLLRFKQICNHPSQWLGYGDYAIEESGKFSRLIEICEEIAAKQEKVLVFSQFREVIPALERALQKVFRREGLTLHGDTAISKRKELVDSFQQEQGPPFFVLSLKAGGTGLNLTRASHVIHFDRWWNPSVENQATDRAYRIGQKNPVLVHKFICRGTIEEKIDAIISAKKNLAQEVLEGGSELLLTELSNEELLNMIALDIHRAME